MGFKPAGDDARPDRGLPPLTRMLIGQDQDLLTVVYGPAKKNMWSMLHNDPITLGRRNGLWESIFAVSNAILVDSATDNITKNGYLRSHWESVIPLPRGHKQLIQPFPIHIGENDVDTVLHTILGHCAGYSVYEGLCNPPGGDWSGVSLQPAERNVELRWISLPRVSGTNTKRPDHVFQFFGIADQPIILSIESKELASAVEVGIGPQLSRYIANLITSPASIERTTSDISWHHSSHQLNPSNFIFASAVAYISNSQEDINAVMLKASIDLILAYSFQNKGTSCNVRLIPKGKKGELLAKFIASLNLKETGITIQLN